MFRRVLVGVDGHTGGRDAIALGQALIEQSGQLTLAHVCRPARISRRDSSSDTGDQTREDGIRLLERTRAQARVAADLQVIINSSVGRGLHELAESMRADVLVVGCSRRGRLGRVFLKDDALASLDGAACAVAIAPAGYVRSRHRLQEIGVGYNDWPESQTALAVGRRLAKETGARLSACEAVLLPSRLYPEGVAGIEATVERLVSDARRRLSRLGDVEPRAVYGDPAHELARYSDSVDLLIVGSRGLGRAGRLLAGSTSRSLVRTAGCPLLVVDRAANLGRDQPVLEGVADELGP
ncbi:MAG: universal stress protein [Solirubrobacterales bacterium]|nr:universal stress protein [Solirubrobacterales bacterium]